MIALAFELSTVRGSVAILDNGLVAASESWSETSVRGQHAFTILPDLLRRAGIGLEAVEVFIAGRGPGAYSGLRVAITAAQSLALPGARRVFATSSGEALAREAAEKTGSSQVAVIGDARREQLWIGIFERAESVPGMKVLQPWSLLRPAELASALPANVLLVSADWTRLLPKLGGLDLSNVRTGGQDWYPTAEGVGRIALEKMFAGLESEPLSPIYMHPAV